MVFTSCQGLVHFALATSLYDYFLCPYPALVLASYLYVVHQNFTASGIPCLYILCVFLIMY